MTARPSSVVTRLRRRPRDEGRAIIEFIFLGLLLLLPLVYLVLAAARVQAGAFSVSLAGREAARAFVTAASEAEAQERAHTAAALAFEDFAFEAGDVRVSCDATPCLRPGGSVTAVATITVPLPLVPDFIADRVPTSVTVSSTHVSTVDTFVTRGAAR